MSMTSYKSQINAKPKAVRTFLKVYMTKASIDDPAPDWDLYAAQALDFWTDLQHSLAVMEVGLVEKEVAEMLVERLRGQEGWGRILREAGD